MNDLYDTEYNQPVSLHPCSICGRKFRHDVLQKHSKICQKNASKKPRKEFNPAKQRLDELGVKVPPSKNVSLTKNEPPNKPKPNWKKQSEDFRAQMKYARQVKQAELTGQALPEAPKLQNDPTENYIQCQYCGRKFNETAGPRHIKFCETQAKKVPRNKPENTLSQFKQDKRLNYRPPKLVKKESGTGFGSSTTNFAGDTTTLGRKSPSIRNMYGKQNSATTRSSIKKNPTTNDPFDLHDLDKVLGSTRQVSAKNPRNISRNSAVEKRGPHRIPASKFISKSCDECRTDYPVDWAKFCSMCGKKRR